MGEMREMGDVWKMMDFHHLRNSKHLCTITQGHRATGAVWGLGVWFSGFVRALLDRNPIL